MKVRLLGLTQDELYKLVEFDYDEWVNSWTRDWEDPDPEAFEESIRKIHRSIHDALNDVNLRLVHVNDRYSIIPKTSWYDFCQAVFDEKITAFASEMNGEFMDAVWEQFIGSSSWQEKVRSWNS